MAHFTHMIIGTQLAAMYTVENPVGWGCRASKVDVMLVQFYLSKWIKVSVAAGKQRPLHIKQDGRFGSITDSAIRLFQNSYDELACDGRVGPIRGHSNRWRSDMYYTLYVLGLSYAMHETGVDPNEAKITGAQFADANVFRIGYDPDASPELRAGLSR